MASTVRPGFPLSPARPAALLGRLRQQLRAVEASTALSCECTGAVALGFAPIDDMLGGGLACGALHEIAAPCEVEIAAATGFALALAARQAMSGGPKRNVVWIVEDLSQAESGALYGPGVDETGLAPERLITVTAARGRDALWAMEEALRCSAVGVVIGELRTRDIDTVATRRLSLAAAAGNALALLLRTTPSEEPSAAATRWIIGAARADEPASGRVSSARSRASSDALCAHTIEEPRWPLASLASTARALLEGPRRESPRWSVGPPCLTVRLVRNRRGRLGTWIVEWNNAEQRFEPAALSEPVAGTVLDRPYRAAVA